MSKTEEFFDEETPSWLKTIQINSWEAELLISALLLYVLFQIPAQIDEYRLINFNSGDRLYIMMAIFADTLEVLRLGYVIHIITRGIWVANIGLSSVYSGKLDVQKLGLKGKFKEEIERSRTLSSSVLRLERIASMAYAISFMFSGILLSFGVVLVLSFSFIDGAFMPWLASGNPWLGGIGLVILFTYLIVLFIVFIDFITNGIFRKDRWASKYYYYIAIFFRYVTLSFIYNRILLTLIANMRKRTGHLIPFVILAVLVGYKVLDNKTGEWKRDDYYNKINHAVITPSMYENLISANVPVFATIQSDIINGNVLKVFIRSLEEIEDIFNKDRSRVDDWNRLSDESRIDYYNKTLKVQFDSSKFISAKWRKTKHPRTYRTGYTTFIDISSLSGGEHMLKISIDTTDLNDQQKEVLLDYDPPRVIHALIPFYKQ